MEQNIELLKLGEVGTSVEEVIEEFIQLGVERWGEGLAGMVGPLREAIRAGKVDGWAACSGAQAWGIIVCTQREGHGRVNFIHVLTDHQGKEIERLLIERAVAEFEKAGLEQITSEALVLGDGEAVRDAFITLGFRSLGRMVMSLKLISLPEPVPSPGYELVPWDDRYLESVVQLIFEANRDGPDRLIYPELRTAEGTGHMVQGIRAGAVGPFDEEASSLTLRDGSPCGTILFTRPAPDQGFVAEMAVAEEHRGKGLGKALLARALAIAQKQGIGTVKLGVTEENRPAVGLYRKLGFTPEQRLTAYIRGGADG